MDGTMQRTKKYLAYFGKSFFRDKIAITLILLIILTIIGIIYGKLHGKDDNSPPKKFEQ
jgi:hypothetical protein